jgi:hypothetical protein
MSIGRLDNRGTHRSGAKDSIKTECGPTKVAYDTPAQSTMNFLHDFGATNRASIPDRLPAQDSYHLVKALAPV